MEMRSLGSTGLSVSAVGMGTWKTFDVRDEKAERRCQEVVDRAVKLGTILFDTSPMYGDAERVLEKVLAAHRDQVFVADKVWTQSASEGRQQIQRALDWYGVVDIYQVHNLVAWQQHLPVIEDLKQQGRVAAVGATHYQHSALPELMKVMESGRIQVVQIPYNAGDRFVEQEVLPLADELGLGVLVMQPLGTGALVGRAPAALHDFERFGIRTWPQVLLKWILSDPRVHSVLPATGNPEHAEENARAGSPPWFDPDTRDWIARQALRLS